MDRNDLQKHSSVHTSRRLQDLMPVSTVETAWARRHTLNTSRYQRDRGNTVHVHAETDWIWLGARLEFDKIWDEKSKFVFKKKQTT